VGDRSKKKKEKKEKKKKKKPVENPSYSGNRGNIPTTTL